MHCISVLVVWKFRMHWGHSGDEGELSEGHFGKCRDYILILKNIYHYYNLENVGV